MTTPSLQVRLFGVLCVLSGCAIAPNPDEDPLDFELDAGEPARTILADASSASELDASVGVGMQELTQDAGGSKLDARAPEDATVNVTDASAHDASTGGANTRDASTSDAGRDASTGTSDAATATDSGSGGACVPAQCNVSCLTQVCCSALGQCACEDLLGLCIIPAI